jgi:2-amino-4-hydroxy-6-hydroxymethyldihydropteridine diphosphokinase
MQTPNIVFILLGGNIEPRVKLMEKARLALGQKLGNLLEASSIYESEAWGFKTDTDFYNQVLKVATIKDVNTVLEIAMEIETKLGRQRDENGGYAKRTMDIDILYFNTEIIDKKNLTVPHPRLHLRRFTLLPLSEIAPDFVHPLMGKSNEYLLKVCNDKGNVRKLD